MTHQEKIALALDLLAATEVASTHDTPTSVQLQMLAVLNKMKEKNGDVGKIALSVEDLANYLTEKYGV